MEPLQSLASRVLAMGMTVQRICKKLSKENPDVCALADVAKKNYVSPAISQIKPIHSGEFEHLSHALRIIYDAMTEDQKREVSEGSKNGILFF